MRPAGLVLTDNAPSDDVRVLHRIAGGDAEALGVLYDRYGRVVYGVLRRMLPSPEAAEEVAQDVFHAIWQKARHHQPERGTVRTWLLAIVRNAAVDWRRTKGKRIEREVTMDAPPVAVDTPVDDRVIASLQAERVRLAVASLPSDQRDVLALAYWGGLSQSEIAARIGAPLGTVKSRVRLGMAKLRERLASEAGAGA